MKTDKQQLDELCKITGKLINGFHTQHNIRCWGINDKCTCGRDNLLKQANEIIEANKYDAFCEQARKIIEANK